MSDHFWLTEEQLSRIEPFFPLSHGVARVDDRKVVSGIIHVIRNGLRWRDAPEVYGPHKTLYNRFIRWSRMGIFDVSVRPDRSAAHRESAIVSANDSGHYGFLDGASYKAALDRRREAVDLFSDDGIGHIGCPGGASICDECEPDFQMAA